MQIVVKYATKLLRVTLRDQEPSPRSFNWPNSHPKGAKFGDLVSHVPDKAQRHRFFLSSQRLPALSVVARWLEPTQKHLLLAAVHTAGESKAQKWLLGYPSLCGGPRNSGLHLARHSHDCESHKRAIQWNKASRFNAFQNRRFALLQTHAHSWQRG